MRTGILLTAALAVIFGAALAAQSSYDLRSPADQALAFDYDSSGRADHVTLYRPGTGTIWILRRR